MLLIDVNALIADIERTVEESGCVNHEGDIMDCVRYAPTISAVPVVRGRWVGKTPETRHEYVYPLNYKCSNCGFLAKYDGWRYCPNCGAKMDGKRKEEPNG